jgi:hypothetical protein
LIILLRGTGCFGFTKMHWCEKEITNKKKKYQIWKF